MTKRTAWLLGALFWAMFGLVIGFQVWISMITHGHSVPRLLFYYFLISEGWLLASAAIVLLARRFPVVPPRRLHVLVHLLAASVIGVLHSAYWIALLLLMKPFDRMTAELSRIDISYTIFCRVPVEWTLYCLVLGCATAFEFYSRYRERALAATQLQASLTDARLHALELQLQPHFLFNTMNAVSSLVRTNRNEEAINMLAGLSELLRYTLDQEGKQRAPLGKELEILRRYLEIQQARFSDRMSFHIDASEETMRAAVPTLLLQPIAENGVQHAFALRSAPGTIEVRARREGAQLRLEVFNSGVLDPEPKNGIGLTNTIARLEHLYGAAGSFELKAVEGGVVAVVSIPWSEIG